MPNPIDDILNTPLPGGLASATNDANIGQMIGFGLGGGAPRPNMPNLGGSGFVNQQVGQAANDVGNLGQDLPIQDKIGSAVDFTLAPVRAAATRAMLLGGAAEHLYESADNGPGGIWQGLTDPVTPSSLTSQFGNLPLGLQMLALARDPAARFGGVRTVPTVDQAAIANGASVSDATKLAQQGELSAYLGQNINSPLSQIEQLYAKINPVNQGIKAAGAVISKTPILNSLTSITPLARGLQVADMQNATVRAFGNLLRNAGVDLNPDQFYNLQRVVASSKDESAQQAAALSLTNAEEKITQYVRGETPGVSATPLGAQGSDLGLQAGAQAVSDATQNGMGAALPPPTRVIPITEDEWAGRVKKALKDNGDQTSYIVTNSGQRYAISPIPPGGSLRQRIFNGSEVRTQSGEQVPLTEVQEIQDPQGQVVDRFPQYGALMRGPAVNKPLPPLGNLPSSREQQLSDKAMASQWIQEVINGIQENPLSDNLKGILGGNDKAEGLGIDPNQLTNALRVRSGVQGKIANIANTQTQALDDIANSSGLVINKPSDVLNNPDNLAQAVSSNVDAVNRLRQALGAGKSYLANGDLTGLDNQGLNAAVDKGFNDLYQRAFQATANQSQSKLGRWAGNVLSPIGGAIANTIMASQGGVPLPVAIGIGGAGALLNELPAARVLGQSLKQTKRLVPGWSALMNEDEGLKSLINGVQPLITPGTILSNFTKWGDVTPEAEQALANMGPNAQFNPYSKDMEDALSQVKLGPLSEGGQVQSELQQGYRGIGKLGQYLNQATGGRLPQVESGAGNWEQSLNRAMVNQDMLMRLSAASQGKQEVMNQVAPHFAQSIQDAAPNAAKEIADSGGAVSQNRLADLLNQDGITGDARQNMMGQWQNLLDLGTQNGVNLANKIHYNFRYGTGMDQFMNQFLLNHVWATRNLQNYPQMLAEHPFTLPLVAHMLDSLNERRQDNNGTLRFMGMVPGTSPLEKMLSVLGVQPEGSQAWYEPTEGVSIADQLLPLWTYAVAHARRGESVGNTLLDSTSGLALGMNPISQMGLQAAGAVNEKSYSPLFSLANAPINAMQARGALPMPDGQPTNLDPLSGAANWLRERIVGYQPNLMSREIQREAENIAIENGLPPNSPQTAMAANDPSSPLWQAAARRVAGQKSIASVERAGGLPDYQFEAPGEQTTQRLAGDPLWQPNLSDPVEQMLFAPWTIGNEQLTKGLQSFMHQQESQYNRERLNAQVQSPAVVELLARAAVGNPQLQQQLAQQGLSVTGGNTPTVVGANGQTIDPNLARQLFSQNSGQFIPDFSNVGRVASQVSKVPPAVRQGMTMGPPPQDDQLLRAWDSGDPAIRAKILADPQTRAVIAHYKQGVNP